MKRIAKKLAALSLAAVMALGLVACGQKTDPEPTGSGTTGNVSYADQIVVGITQEPKYIEPNAPGVGPAEINVTQQIYEGLVSTGQDGRA